MTPTPDDAPEWRVSPDLIPYPQAVDLMEARAAEIRAGKARELVWLLQHPPLLTAGTSAKQQDLLHGDRLPVFPTGRGGQYTYHGPGQRVGYLMLDLQKRGRDVRRFVSGLEDWLISALGTLGLEARQEPGRIGIWVDDRFGREAKIGAIGVRIRRWVTLHGFSLNVAPDLSHFQAIVPCGLPQYPVTSLQVLGHTAGLQQVDDALLATFPRFLQALGEGA
jgi:lipoyl(octanoyl) transferase